MATPVRRMSPSSAAARGAAKAAAAAPVPKQQLRSRTEEVGRGHVSFQAKDREGPYYEDSKEVEVLRRTFDEGQHPAFVKVGAGLTINMQNYESLRLDCAVTLPCLPTELEEAYEIASQFVADRLAEEETSWLGAVKTSPKRR